MHSSISSSKIYARRDFTPVDISGYDMKTIPTFNMVHDKINLNAISKTDDVINKGLFTTSKQEGGCSLDGTHQGGCSLSNGSGKLLPIMDARFNLRESSKHIILLEDHLFNEGKRCIDCIKKHFMTIEAFLEEGISLDKQQKYIKLTKSTLDKFRNIMRDFSKKLDTKKIKECDFIQTAQNLREIRKPLMQASFSLN